jgi:hypothetical protein
MDRKITTVVGIVLALVFVGLLTVIFDMITSTGNSATDTFGSTKDAIVYNELKQFDGGVVSGTTVISTINNLRESKAGTRMSYVVKNGTTYTAYGYGGIAASSSYTVSSPGTTYTQYKVTDVNSSGYISDSSKYSASIAKATNGTIVGIIFERK